MFSLLVSRAFKGQLLFAGKDTGKGNITQDLRVILLLPPVIKTFWNFKLVIFFKNIRLHFENQYLPAWYDEFSYHYFTVSFDLPGNSFFFFLIFNIQSRTLLQLSVVNYIHNIVQSAQHMQIQPCSSIINSFMTDVPVI